MALEYHAVLVNKDGIVEYIRPCGTLKTERDMVAYWKKGNRADYWKNSFVAKQPLNFKGGDKICTTE